MCFLQLAFSKCLLPGSFCDDTVLPLPDADRINLWSRRIGSDVQRNRTSWFSFLTACFLGGKAMNWVELILKALGGNVLDQLASALGLDRQKSEGAVKAAVPGLLGALVNMARTPDGADKLYSSLDDVDDGLLGDLGKAFGGGSSLADKGTGLLGSLLGSGTVGDLAGVIGRFAGLGGGTSSSLLGMLAPVVLGFLKKQSRESKLDASGLANLLKGQERNVSSALPGNLGEMLGSVQGLSGMSDWATDTAGAAVRTGQAAASRAASTVTAPPSSGMKWLWPLLAAVLVLWLLCASGPAGSRMCSRRLRRWTGLSSPCKESCPKSRACLTKQRRTLRGLRMWLPPRRPCRGLRDLSTRAGNVSSAIQSMPDEHRGEMLSMWNDAKTTLTSLIDTVLALPGVRDVIGPVVEEIIQKLG